MRLRKKSTVKPELPKEYVWTLEIDGEEKLYKCLVTETEVITYEGDVECKHLKIMDPTCMEGVLQIDTKTRIYGDLVEFQLERFIPYIRLEGHWAMSDTTERDRRDELVKIHKKNSLLETVTGSIMLLVLLAKWLITGEAGQWWILSIFGIFFLSSAAVRMVRLRNELNLLKELEEEAAAEKAVQEAEKAAQKSLEAGDGE